MPGHIRDPLLEACDEGFDWWKAFEAPDEALRVLGKLWQCTDIVPNDARQNLVDWLEIKGGLEPEEAKGLRAGCTYAQLVRRLKPALRQLLDEQSERSGSN